MVRTGQYLYILLFFLFIISINRKICSEIIFESNFEQGNSFLQAPADSGQKDLTLVEGENLAEWPLDSGWGLLGPESQETRDYFTYKSRKANRLHGVKGIQRPHAAYTSACFGGFEKGWMERIKMQIEYDEPLIGNFSIASDSARLDPYNFERNIPKTREFYLRFYIQFRNIVVTEKKPGVKGTGLYFLSLSEKVKKQENSLFVFWLLDLQKANQRLVLSIKSGSGMEDDSLVHSIKIDSKKKYCIEAHVRVGDSKQGGAEWWLDGKHIGSLFSINNSHVDGINRCTFRCRTLSGAVLKKDIVYDQIAAATHYLGTVPPRPLAAGFNNKGLLLCHPPVAKTNDAVLNASQWQLDTLGNWMWPFYNSGEIEGSLGYFDVSEIVIPGKKYLFRVRYKNSLGNWGSFCTPVSFSVPHDFSNKAEKPKPPFTIKDISIRPEPEGEPLKEINQESWYFLAAELDKINVPDDVSFLHVWLHTPFYTFGNIRNKGAGFNEKGNYIISFSLSSSSLVTRISGQFIEPFSNAGVQGMYVDDSDNLYQKNLEKGKIICRFKIPDAASKGPWRIEAFCMDIQGNTSPIYSRDFTVKEPVPEKLKTSRLAISLIFAGILFIIVLVLFTIRKTLQSRKEVSDARIATREEELVEKAIQFIHENYQNDITSSDIAKCVGLSENYFRSIFKKIKKEKLFNYLTCYRLEMAKKLIKTTNFTISEILLKVGYKDSSTFSRIFKKNEGITPVEYMKKIRSKT